MASDDDPRMIAGTGITVGLLLGFGAGLALDNLALWLSVGLVLGIWIDHWSAS